eukprot:TRINITY_DN68123_c0_g1_i1.p1 TRINITY_DN68123_c0_g1~~TRINITY_DN68123_c0_g1_i1.p1  ORF type:complete len:250 (-),score=62.65 TRINITY_DN68123_c0_g1_i1:152-841(-)
MLCCFAALALSALAGHASWARHLKAAALVLGVKEAHTGVEFPVSSGKQLLVATGVRKKFGAVKVYAVALYLEKGSKLWNSPASAEKLLKEAPGKVSLHIVITSSLVTKAKLSDALQESLGPRLEASGLEGDAALEVLRKFDDVLAGGPDLKRGMRLQFKLEKNRVKVSIGKKYASEVESSALVQALLGTYVDEKAVSPAFREAIFKGIAERSDAAPPRASAAASFALAV